MRNAKAVIVGGDTLMGRELRELLSDLPVSVETELIDPEAADEIRLTVERGEPSVIQRLEEQVLVGADVTFVASAVPPASLEKLLNGEDAPRIIIDVSHTLEGHPEAVLRAPLAEPDGFTAENRIQVIAHPAAIALAVFLDRLAARHPVKRCVVHVFEPASERGQAGLDELQQQTIGLLSFKPLKKDVYDTQVSFAMLTAYGESAGTTLESIEQRIEKHLATLLERRGLATMPSLRLLQAPVFHAYTISAWVEFEERPDTATLAESLACSNIAIAGSDEPAPNNVGVAGQSGLSVGAIAPDHNDRRSAWFWIAADNLRLVAENAVLAARPFLVPGGSGV